MNIESIVFGKKKIERIVSCEVADGKLHLFIDDNGSVVQHSMPNYLWICAPERLDEGFKPLAGQLHYRFIKYYKFEASFWDDYRRYKEGDIYCIHDQKEATMVMCGFTYFREMKVEDVGILSWDIETIGLLHEPNHKVLLISNTFEKNGQVIKKLFSYDEYKNDYAFIDAWCAWVREIDPTVICGHNIYTFDLPYMNLCAKKVGGKLLLGRDGSEVTFSKRPSAFRRDGSQSIDYHRAHIFGREIADTWFLAMKYDVGRKYETYKLKSIIAQEKLQKADRTFYDAGTIKDNYRKPEEWVKIKEYARDDADDALALYKLMVPSYFYLTQSVPKSFQTMLYSASGSQINSILVRSYLQYGHSLPKASEAVDFEGAISFGNPGVYRNVKKLDVASLYPSLMLTYEVFDREKDPQGNFLQMVRYFTAERLANKKRSKETGEKYFKDLQESQKIVINSAYGMMGATGLLFNSPHNAARVTELGRETLQRALDWASAKGFVIPNGDTDSLCFCYPDFRAMPKSEQDALASELNSLFPTGIEWADDGFYLSMLVLKAKNYALLKEDGKLKLKGSALKSSSKERAFKEFQERFIWQLLTNPSANPVQIYEDAVKDILKMADITKYSSKRTVTKTLLKSMRANETKVVAALDEADKSVGTNFYCYFKSDGSIGKTENFDGDIDRSKLFDKLHSTMETFETIVDMKLFPNFALVRNQKHLVTLLLELELFDGINVTLPAKPSMRGKSSTKGKDDTIENVW